VISLPGGGFAAASATGWVFLFRRLPEGEKAYYRQVSITSMDIQPDYGTKRVTTFTELSKANQVLFNLLL
jgi:hypothetical protein